MVAIHSVHIERMPKGKEVYVVVGDEYRLGPMARGYAENLKKILEMNADSQLICSEMLNTLMRQIGLDGAGSLTNCSGAVLALDLKGFSELSGQVEGICENSLVTLLLQVTIENFVETVLSDMKFKRNCKPLRHYEGGDSAILVFPSPPDAHIFVENLNEASRKRAAQSDKNPLWFRVGGHYGTITYVRSNIPNRVHMIAGLPITIATRLQAKVTPGAFMVTNELKREMDTKDCHGYKKLPSVLVKTTKIEHPYLKRFVGLHDVCRTNIPYGLKPGTLYSKEGWQTLWPLVMYGEEYHTFNYLPPEKWDTPFARIGVSLLRGVADEWKRTKGKIGNPVRRIFLLEESIAEYHDLEKLHSDNNIPCRYLNKATFDSAVSQAAKGRPELTVNAGVFSISKLLSSDQSHLPFYDNTAIVEYHYERPSREFAFAYVTESSRELVSYYKGLYEELWEAAKPYNEYRDLEQKNPTPSSISVPS